MQHVPLEEYKRNLRAILAAVQEHAKGAGVRVLLVTPPPVYGPGRIHYRTEVSRGVSFARSGSNLLTHFD